MFVYFNETNIYICFVKITLQSFVNYNDLCNNVLEYTINERGYRL